MYSSLRSISSWAASAIVVLGCAGAPSGAADGRVPVYQPTTISQPGSYYLTRDLTGAAGAAVIDIASDDVTLDLAGHTLRVTGAGYGITAGNRSGVRIANGRIVGGYVGMSLFAGSYVVEHMDVRGQTSTTGLPTGIQIFANVGSPPARAVVRDNQVAGANGSSGRGIFLQNVVGGAVEGNAVVATLRNGIVLYACMGVSVAGNVVSDATGIAILVDTSTDCAVARNVATRSAYGIYLQDGDHNTLDWNVCTNNTTWGIGVSTTSTGNVYSYNRLEANGSGNYFGTSNISAGGNNAGSSNF